MSLDTPPDPANGPHLDEEAVSAALDAEATAEEAIHLRACARCRAAVDRLRSVSDAVAAPVAIDDEVRDAAIAAAIAAHRPAHDERPGASGAPVTTISRRRPGRWRQRTATPWLGMAAALLLVALALPLLRSGSDEEAAETSAADRSTSGGEGAAGGSDEDSAEVEAAGAPVDVGDLGALEREADLRPVIDAALGPVGEEDATDEAVRPESGPAQADASSGGSEEAAEGGAADGSEEGSSATTTAVPPPSSEAPAAADGGPRRGDECEEAVRAALPDAGGLVLLGSATVDGAAAIVYGFAGPGPRETVLAALVRRDGCELVTFQSYARG